MALPVAARIPLIAGMIGLALSVLNQLTAGFADPALQRAGVLASILSVVLMLVGLLWTRITPEAAERTSLDGEEGLLFAAGLCEPLRRELAWGSALLLTASPAATLLLLWNDTVLLRRGLLPAGSACGDPFPPGPICRQAQQRGRSISLVDLRLYPGRAEFEPLLAGLPAVVIQPLGTQGLLLLGGWSARCFSRSDLLWLEGWARKLTVEWAQQLDGAASAPTPAQQDGAPAPD
ncbi:MAG: cofactor assembly of complex C subunit B [Synechococcaceae cyanobacterium]|nr:cofactor assembly of complex C subunit B [Synechococcaceae cyanobacterium]